MTIETVLFVMFQIAKNAIERSNTYWSIKPGLKEQTFQITFSIISDKMVTIIKSDKNNNIFEMSLDRHINYKDAPKELTILPTITIIYKEVVIQRVLD
ncbi:hypothetical protein H7F33_08745 [Pedobacter sp. PAMC26386]|nr:hypothetical protein H7F33_08745 [Pedobacter sp. PAMC26386]